MGDETPVQLYPPWRQAVEEFRKAGYTYGATVKREWFYDAFGIEMPKPDTPYGRGKDLELTFLDQITAMRAVLLEEDKMDLKPVRGDFQVYMPQEQTDAAYKDGVREFRKALRRWGRRLINTNVALLTDDGRRKNADALAKLSHLQSLSRRAIRHGPEE